MRKNMIFLMLATVLLVGCHDLGNIDSPKKRIKQDGNTVLAEGRWKAIPGTKAGIISAINSTSITCDRKTMTCREVESLLFTPKEHPFLNHNILYNQEFTYQIIDWSDNIIRAKREALVADVQIAISLRDNFAEKSYRETRARGSDTANPDVSGKWVLE